jgi:hypothetical protein
VSAQCCCAAVVRRGCAATAGGGSLKRTLLRLVSRPPLAPPQNTHTHTQSNQPPQVCTALRAPALAAARTAAGGACAPRFSRWACTASPWAASTRGRCPCPWVRDACFFWGGGRCLGAAWCFASRCTAPLWCGERACRRPLLRPPARSNTACAALLRAGPAALPCTRSRGRQGVP